MDINMCCDLRSVGSTVKIEAAGAMNIVLEVDVSISIRVLNIIIISERVGLQRATVQNNYITRADKKHTTNGAVKSVLCLSINNNNIWFCSDGRNRRCLRRLMVS